MKKVVAIGGGSGLSTLLRSIRDYPLEISAIVTMTDDGASTGKLRRELDVLPPGDIRKCIAALSDNEDLLLELFQYRFRKGPGLKGHSLGNLFLTAAKDIYGNFELAVEGISDTFSTRGKVIPSTLDDTHLVAEFKDKKRIKGESKITKYGYNHKVRKILLDPVARANPKAVSAIREAQYILVGPGSLFTSILPSFLLKEIFESYEVSRAKKIYVCNVSTERGETDGFSVQDHLDVLAEYKIKFDLALYNNKNFRENTGSEFTAPVKYKEVSSQCNLYGADLLNTINPLYHDVEKLGEEIWRLVTTFGQGRKSLFER